jgi:hypothetical protein
MGMGLAGVDIICPDITRTEFWVNEVNCYPFLNIHYAVRNQDQCKDVVLRILAEHFGVQLPT